MPLAENLHRQIILAQTKTHTTSSQKKHITSRQWQCSHTSACYKHHPGTAVPPISPNHPGALAAPKRTSRTATLQAPLTLAHSDRASGVLGPVIRVPPRPPRPPTSTSTSSPPFRPPLLAALSSNLPNSDFGDMSCTLPPAQDEFAGAPGAVMGVGIRRVNLGAAGRATVSADMVVDEEGRGSCETDLLPQGEGGGDVVVAAGTREASGLPMPEPQPLWVLHVW